ncbi:DUF305 domain-containing protein [Saccharopolyspora thermophila]|uniref:DUF305 domain-containing protein n=1 Tax=Saccharopolyspora thermophila TaxID=89367 RepID=A0ABN1BQU8_9PSEU
MNRVLTAVVGAAAAAAVLAGCSGGDMPPMPGHGAPTTAAQPGAEAANAADVAFAQGMIPHHQQAIDMSRLAPERAQSQQVKDLARQIEAAQGPEIHTLSGWLRDWGAPEPHGGMDHGGMGGMMSADEMAQLQAARGTEFDRLFLTMMIRHHEGAVAMARTELAEGRFPAAKQMAQQIIDAQQAEIATMKGLLAQS